MCVCVCVCARVCVCVHECMCAEGSTANLRSHMKVYRININAKDSLFASHICGKASKGVVNLRNHMHAHGSFLQV